MIGSGRLLAEQPEFQWANIAPGDLKTAINGTHHAFKFATYAPRYLTEFQYRFNRRHDPRSMLPRLVRAAMTTAPWPITG